MILENNFLMWNILLNGNVFGQGERASWWLPGSPCANLSWLGLQDRQP